MIKSKTLQEEFRRHINRKNSEYSKSISIADGDLYLNEAIDFIFENLVLKFEVNDFMRNVLSQLKKTNVKLDIEKDGKITKAKLPDNLYKITRRWVTAVKNGCNKKKTFGVHVIQSTDISKTLNDPFFKPSWEWERIISNEENGKILLYHDEIFYPEDVYIDYLKKPNHIATPSMTSGGFYVNSSNEKITQDIDFEIDSTFIWRRVARLAAINALLDIGDIQDYQFQMQQILSLDKIYLN